MHVFVFLEQDNHFQMIVIMIEALISMASVYVILFTTHLSYFGGIVFYVIPFVVIFYSY